MLVPLTPVAWWFCLPPKRKSVLYGMCESTWRYRKNHHKAWWVRGWRHAQGWNSGWGRTLLSSETGRFNCFLFSHSSSKSMFWPSLSLNRFAADGSKGNSESLAHPSVFSPCVISLGFGLLFIRGHWGLCCGLCRQHFQWTKQSALCLQRPALKDLISPFLFYFHMLPRTASRCTMYAKHPAHTPLTWALSHLLNISLVLIPLTLHWKSD